MLYFWLFSSEFLYFTAKRNYGKRIIAQVPRRESLLLVFFMPFTRAKGHCNTATAPLIYWFLSEGLSNLHLLRINTPWAHVVHIANASTCSNGILPQGQKWRYIARIWEERTYEAYGSGGDLFLADRLDSQPNLADRRSSGSKSPKTTILDFGVLATPENG